jgi:glycosyltransferase involved in cell wall biosynthesis
MNYTTSQDYFISVVICTYNNLVLLKRSVKAILKQSLEKEKYEVLIINNNSNDGTANYIKSLLAKEKNLKYFNEKRQGLSYARNRGIAESMGEIITFLDDDAIARKDLLESIYHKFNDYPSILCLGGKVIPKIEFNVPDWMEKRYRNFLVLEYDLGEQDCFLDKIYGPVGANISFKKNVFEKFGNFDIRLGRVKDKYLSNEEEKLLFAIKKLKKSCLYTSKAVVYHIAKKTRVGRKFLLHRAYYKGISDARSRYSKKQIVHGLSKSLWRKAGYTLLSLFVEICKPFISNSIIYLDKKKRLEVGSIQMRPRPAEHASIKKFWSYYLKALKSAFINFKENIFSGIIMTTIYNIAYYLEKFRLFIESRIKSF